MFCKKCGKLLQPEDKMCSKCGTRTELGMKEMRAKQAQNLSSSSSFVSCKSCGKIFSKASRYCPYCGLDYLTGRVNVNIQKKVVTGTASGAWSFLGFIMGWPAIILWRCLCDRYPSISEKVKGGFFAGLITAGIIVAAALVFYIIATTGNFR